MPNVHRNIFKHLVIVDNNNSVLTDVYLATFEDVRSYIAKNFPLYECTIVTLKDLLHHRPIIPKYSHLVNHIKLVQVFKKDIPKHSIIIVNHH